MSRLIENIDRAIAKAGERFDTPGFRYLYKSLFEDLSDLKALLLDGELKSAEYLAQQISLASIHDMENIDNAYAQELSEISQEVGAEYRKAS